MSIRVEQVTKLYGTQKAVDEASFSMNKGEVVGLLGPNGAGKSTLMKILTCFIPPTSGKAFVMEYDVQEHPLEVQRLVGYLPEHNPLYLDMYVREYLGFIAGIHQLGSKTAQRVSDMVEITGLGREQHKKIGALSKGYRQRVGLAQALIHDPAVLILDEPTSGLDPNQLADIRQLIREAGKEKTVILSTHIMQEVEAICSRAIIIHQGKIVADDNTEHLTRMSGPKQTYTIELEQAADLKKLPKPAGIRQLSSTDQIHWMVEPQDDQDVSRILMQWALDNRVTIRSMQKTENSLEDIFRKLTSR
jgi:ABC-2 type transport system ATP-binding protein